MFNFPDYNEAQIKVGDVVRVHRSKKKENRKVAFTPSGKVIFIKNDKDIHFGFAEILSFVEKEKYIIATVKNVVSDFYYGYKDGETIPYSELVEVLKLHSFTQELKLPIDATHFELTGENFFDVWANLDTGDLVTIETWNDDGVESYNSVKLYVPVNSFVGLSSNEHTGFTFGCNHMCCFDLVNCLFDFPLHMLMRCSNKSRDWKGETPSLWHYGDRLYDEGCPLDFAKILERIYDAKDDIGTLFNMRIEEKMAKYRENSLFRVNN